MTDLQEGLDGLQDDMAAHQRRFSGEPTAESNRQLAADLIQRMDNEQREAKPMPPRAQVDPPTPIAQESTERREIDGKNYLVSKGPDAPLLRVPTPAEAWALQHMMPRVELLMSKVETGPLGEPSWNSRLMAVLELKSRVSGLRTANLHDLADDIERRYTFELFQLLEDSNRVFGDWKNPPGAKVYSFV